MRQPLKASVSADEVAQVVSELAAWMFFLVMLGELAWSEAEKAKILDFYGANK